MANIISTADAKLFLGIVGSSEDTLIDALSKSAEARFCAEIGVDSMQTGTRTEKFSAQGNVFFCKNWPVTAVSKVNGTAYVGADGTDFDVSFGRRLEILNLDPYLVSLKFDRFPIEYVAGYATNSVPEDLRNGIMLMIGALYNSRSAQGMASYSIGEENVTFRTADEETDYRRVVNTYKNR